MNKQCEYCHETFEAKRKDTKYCSNTCKQSAYIARSFKDNVIEPDYSEHQVINASSQSSRYYPSKRSKAVNDSITLSRSEFTRLLSSSSSKAPLDHLLNEKDFGRDILSQNSELRIELKFLNKELEQLRQKHSLTLEEKNKLEEELDSLEESASTKLLSVFMEHADSTMPAIQSLCSALAYKISGVKPAIAGGSAPSQTDQSQNPPSHDYDEEQVTQINSYLSEMMKLYPDIPIVDILKKIVELIKTKKSLADTILYS